MTETPAKGTKGFLLYSPFDEQFFFRIYTSEDKREFKDFRLAAEDIEVEILADDLSFYEDGERKKLDWSSEVLGK